MCLTNHNVWSRHVLRSDVTVGLAGQGRQFVMTGSVKGHLHNLARAALMRRYPILLQVGPPGKRPFNVQLTIPYGFQYLTKLYVPSCVK